MTLHPDPEYRPIPVKAVIPRSLGARSQRINPWIPADEPAATICSSEGGYQLKEGVIRSTWQMYRVLTGQGRKNHLWLVKVDPEKPSPAILSGVGGTTTDLVHPWEIRKLTIDEAKAPASDPKAFEIRGATTPAGRGSATASHRFSCGRSRPTSVVRLSVIEEESNIEH